MYEISIDSEQFSGKRLIQQHRMVNEVSRYIIVTLIGPRASTFSINNI